MNDKMIPYEELRGEVRVYKTLVECIAFNMHVIIKMPTNVEMLTQQMLSELEWALRSADTYLPTDLHHEFQVQFLKRLFVSGSLKEDCLGYIRVHMVSSKRI